MKARILVADEEPTFLDSIAYVLEQDGFLVSTACDGETVLAKVQDETPDLIVLSATLPHSLARPICCAIGQVLGSEPSAPIMMWGTETTVSERVDAFDCGVTNYLLKPFGIREFIAHVHAMLRNPREFHPDFTISLYSGGVYLNPASREVYVEHQGGRREVFLTLKEFNLLHVLMAHRGGVVTREALVERIWGTDPATTSTLKQRFNTLSTHIYKLRRKLKAHPLHAPCILTIGSIGYRFNQ